MVLVKGTPTPNGGLAPSQLGAPLQPGGPALGGARAASRCIGANSQRPFREW
jgi:hypothetical protein